MRRSALLVLAFLCSVIATPVLTQTASPLSIFPSRVEVSIADLKRDILAYVSPDNHLMLYDPQSRTQTMLLQNVKDFALAQTGKVAFTKLDENDKNIYVYDPSTPATPPVSVPRNPGTSNYLENWSPDGRYLAFITDQNDKPRSIHIWDGKATQDITPRSELGHAQLFYTDWSQDGRLVLTAIYIDSDDKDLPSEIFVWDGLKTMNLSQNPKGDDGEATWSKSGKLKFVLQRNGEYGLYIWDGVSFKNGAPDTDKFVRIAAELKAPYATWTDDGLVALTVEALSPSDKRQIVLWDVDRNKEIKRIPVSSNNDASWLTGDGQTILSVGYASGIPSYDVEVENSQGNILFSIHTGEYSWSASGYLAYCGINGKRSELLSIWNGSESWLVATVSYKPAQWQSGERTFSCNNG